MTRGKLEGSLCFPDSRFPPVRCIQSSPFHPNSGELGQRETLPLGKGSGRRGFWERLRDDDGGVRGGSRERQFEFLVTGSIWTANNNLIIRLLSIRI